MRFVAAIAVLAALGAAGAGCASRSEAASGTIEIEIHHSRFVPARISLGGHQSM
ncbi:MAG: hypothetical protein JO176_07755, partial [Acidimicrobiia bacterium]|nr:hypothetical protein [Acidimicrobiia bacterium]